MRHLVYLLPFIAFLFSCSDSSCESDISDDVQVNVTLHRVDKEIKASKDSKEALSLLEKHSALVNYFVDSNLLKEESERFIFKNNFANGLFKTSKIKELDTVFHQIDVEFTDSKIKSITSELHQLCRNLKNYDPIFRDKEVYTIVSAFGDFDLDVNQDMILIGLEYFLKDKAFFDPHNQNYPQYILRHFQPENIPAKCAQLFQRNYNKFDKLDRKLISYMIYYGKALYFTKQMLPCTADSVIFEYENSELAWLNKFEYNIYARFQDNEWFYNENRDILTKMIDPRPKAEEIADKCPGRVGRWLGYKIVEAYMNKHPETKLGELMETSDAVALFTQSGYKPPKP